MIVPEKTSKVRRFLIPSWLLRGSFVGIIFLSILGAIMVLDYWFVMDQISENKELKVDNRRLKQQLQIYKNKIATIESTMDRVESFSTRLKVITNIEDRENLVEKLNENLPDADTNTSYRNPNAKELQAPTPLDALEEVFMGTSYAQSAPEFRDPEVLRLKRDQIHIENSLITLNRRTLFTEQNLQDLYELLIDQKSFLQALPTRKPTRGYISSGFGIRKHPIHGNQKMHEGIDIANVGGTPILSPANGTVKFSGRKPGYGRTVIIDHGYGLETLYGHCRKTIAKRGEKIYRGDRIALMGSTGRVSGPHLHYEVRINGIPVDPLTYILD
tara:strand:- start:2674 stop:3660 length:987 start_codon:yes stop_codon:yes gene_type:complete